MRGFRKALVWFLLVAAVVAGVAYAFFIDVWTVTEDDPRLGGALAPNMAIGDVVFLSKDPGARLGCF